MIGANGPGPAPWELARLEAAVAQCLKLGQTAKNEPLNPQKAPLRHGGFRNLGVPSWGPCHSLEKPYYLGVYFRGPPLFFRNPPVLSRRLRLSSFPQGRAAARRAAPGSPELLSGLDP